LQDIDEATKIKDLIAEGDYFQAIGVRSWSTRLDIETTSARLSDTYPELAGVLSNITQVIIDQKKREIYEITCEFRDQVIQSLANRFGNDFLKSVPYCRRTTWLYCQRLLRCNFEKSDIKIGPGSATSLADHGQEWVIEDVVNSCLSVFQPSAEAKRLGCATITFQDTNCSKCSNLRWISCTECEGNGKIRSNIDDFRIPVLVDDFDLIDDDFTTTECTTCKGTGHVPCDCRDNYTFQIPANAEPGSVIVGRGARTKKILYVILDHNVTSPRPTWELINVYQSFNLYKNLGWNGLEHGQTLEDVQATLNWIPWIGTIGWLLLGAMIGKYLGSWQTGAATSIVIPVALNIRMRHPFWNASASWIWTYSLIFVQSAFGAIIGTLLSTWQIGATISGIMSAVFLAFIFISTIFKNRMMR
jgi:hypothetical protein